MGSVVQSAGDARFAYLLRAMPPPDSWLVLTEQVSPDWLPASGPDVMNFGFDPTQFEGTLASQLWEWWAAFHECCIRVDRYVRGTPFDDQANAKRQLFCI